MSRSHYVRMGCKLVLLTSGIACGSSTPSKSESITTNQATAGVTAPPSGAPNPTAASSAGSSAIASQPSAAGAGVRPGTPNIGDVPNTPQASGGSSAPVETGSKVPSTPAEQAGGSVDWTMMGYDVGSTYFNAAETTLTKESAAKLEVAWTAEMGGNVYGAALQVGDKIYATAPGSVRAFEAASGKELWKTTASSTSALAYADGSLYLNTLGAQIIALDPGTGMMQWSKPHNTVVKADGSSSAIPAGDVIIVGGSSGVDELSGGGKFRGYFSGVDRKTGELKWSTFTVPEGSRGASVWSTLSADLGLGLGFAGTGNNYGMPTTDTSDAIIAFELSTGAIKWKNQRVKNDGFGGGSGPDADFGANPVLYEANVGGSATKLVADGNKGGSVFAMKREDGMLLWERSLGAGTADGSKGIFTNFAWSGKHLVVACNEGGPATLYALDGATGEIAWMRKLTGQVWGRTAFANGVGFVGTGTTLEAFDVDTGAVIKSWPSTGTIASTITISRGRVAFGEGLSWSGGKRGTKLTVLAVK